MENYKKGKNIEEPLERYKIPIPNLPDNFLWMQVRGGSKIRNLLAHALSLINEVKTVVWTGFGQSVGKTITCVEIMKRESSNSLHQITKLCYRTVEEYWDPLVDDLDQIVVKRKLPMIHIVLSVEPLDTKELGYQAPGVFIPYKNNCENVAGGSSSTGKQQFRNKKVKKAVTEMDGRGSRKNNKSDKT